jgi:hypothetical protein
MYLMLYIAVAIPAGIAAFVFALLSGYSFGFGVLLYSVAGSVALVSTAVWVVLTRR